MNPNLIYDVGMHNGDDTAYYLFRGYSVVAIEANPLLVEAGRQRFAAEIAAGRLTILPVGITAEPGTNTFWVNEVHSEWSSFVKGMGCRDGTPCHAIEVSCVRFGDVLAEHGVPYYLKVDIEGLDALCLKALDPADLPPYVSAEGNYLGTLCEMYSAGYRGFKLVNQTECWKCQSTAEWEFPGGSSGAFGEDAPGEWEDLETTAYTWLHFRMGHFDRGRLTEGWYDFHGTVHGPRRVGPTAASFEQRAAQRQP